MIFFFIYFSHIPQPVTQIVLSIEQFYYVTFWHSKVKTDTFIKYHIQVYDLKYTIKKH